MNTTLITILLVLIAILLIVCIVLLILNRKKIGEIDQIDQAAAFRSVEDKIRDVGRVTSEEFHRSRVEAAGNKDAVVKQIAELQEKNLESQMNLGDRINRSLGEIREGNEKKLDEMRQTVDEKLTKTLTTRLDSSFKTVSDQLENLYKSLGEMKELSAGVTTNVSSLNRILTNVKARGTWAEVQLESILDQTIPGMYEKNVATKPGSLARVEFAVKIPSGEDSSKFAYLPIDSKFPMEDYARLCEAADAADAPALEAARKALETRVKDEAKQINAYINEPLTTPFAIMYLATEGLYAEVTSSKNGLAEEIQSKYGIMVAGPTTITALLNSLAMGFRAIAINEKANEVRELLSVTKVQYGKFEEILAKAQSKITDAGKALGEAQHRNEIINKKLKNVDAIDMGEADALLQIEE
ncbi:MAG: DNA recombination protein RmuC [Clostridia bacterium]|nr:DNA recombination protein RmuC [Clostridia bacterium]MBR6513058.1 DNA recombination protein RmuC [Clostridia bacterium]